MAAPGVSAAVGAAMHAAEMPGAEVGMELDAQPQAEVDEGADERMQVADGVSVDFGAADRGAADVGEGTSADGINAVDTATYASGAAGQTPARRSDKDRAEDGNAGESGEISRRGDESSESSGGTEVSSGSGGRGDGPSDMESETEKASFSVPSSSSYSSPLTSSSSSSASQPPIAHAVPVASPLSAPITAAVSVVGEPRCGDGGDIGVSRMKQEKSMREMVNHIQREMDIDSGTLKEVLGAAANELGFEEEFASAGSPSGMTLKSLAALVFAQLH